MDYTWTQTYLPWHKLYQDKTACVGGDGIYVKRVSIIEILMLVASTIYTNGFDPAWDWKILGTVVRFHF
jgi:hypothetical protein